MRYELKNVHVTGFSVNGSGNDQTPDSFEFKDTDSPPADSGHDKWIDVLSTDWGTSSGGSAAPTEEITMNYTKIEWTYDEGTGYTATDDLFI